MNKKNMLILLTIITIISLSANVYSFNKLSNEESEINKRNGMILSKKDEEIKKMEDEIETLKIENENTKEKKVIKESDEIEVISDENEVAEITELENAAERFVDYTFNVNEENYVTVKNNAGNYMTDEMVETLFSSEGISEDEMKITTTVDDIEVFTANADEGKAIVQYEVTLDYGNGYEENLKPFVLLYFTNENGNLKVSEVQAINEVGGI